MKVNINADKIKQVINSDKVIIDQSKKNKFNISLPIIKKNFQMDFYSWSFAEPLKIIYQAYLESILGFLILLRFWLIYSSGNSLSFLPVVYFQH